VGAVKKQPGRLEVNRRFKRLTHTELAEAANAFGTAGYLIK
jgi:hypothetical protein